VLILGLLRERPTKPKEKNQSEVYGKFISGGGGLIETLEGLRDLSKRREPSPEPVPPPTTSNTRNPV
jgi:hypothetical protein